jgi:hypothetical protein
VTIRIDVRILLVIVALVLIAALGAQAPEIRRYLKIKRM